MSPTDDTSKRDSLRLWARILLAACVGMVAVVIVMLWVLSGFHGLGLHPQTAIALILGTIGATALSVALMGLLFYSDRSGIDASVRNSSVEHGVPPTDEDRGNA